MAGGKCKFKITKRVGVQFMKDHNMEKKLSPLNGLRIVNGWCRQQIPLLLYITFSIHIKYNCQFFISKQ